MTIAALLQPMPAPHWHWPIGIDQYNRTPELQPAERIALSAFVERFERHSANWSRGRHDTLTRLIQPIDDACSVLQVPDAVRSIVRAVLLREMARRDSSLWAWTDDDWRALVTTGCHVPLSHQRQSGVWQHVLAVGYVLGGCTRLHLLRGYYPLQLATKVFGAATLQATIAQVNTVLASWGYRHNWLERVLPATLATILLVNRSPYLEELTLEQLEAIRHDDVPRALRQAVLKLRRVLAHLGIATLPPDTPLRTRTPWRKPDLRVDVPEPWLQSAERWRATSTLAPQTRKGTFETVLKVGRWLTHTHPEVVLPEQWTRELAAEFVAAVDRWTVGEYTVGNIVTAHFGKPLNAATKTGHYCAMRLFFRDLQEWGWIPTRFDPGRAFHTPRAIKARISHQPRIIADDVWAKLVWAGLNLTVDDVPKSGLVNRRVNRDPVYPLEMIRALVVVWLFSGLRSDEIRRLRVGCTREPSQQTAGGDPAVAPHICWLDVPVNKTGQAFSKPVDALVGEAVRAWEHVRPSQPAMLDRKTSEMVQYLFAYRGYPLSRDALNGFIIPLLCRKAGVPEHDARGHLTSHRARSTIASQLFNAKEPMSLFELQTWLGHRSLNSTQHYARIAPTRLARSYQDAGYFERNVRTIEVLIDQAAVLNGDATEGLPWKYYDLGHGYCTYDFFEQCEHRMACAQCAFYRPKNAYLVLLQEKRAHLLHMRQEIPLTELELAAVEGDLAATDRLITQLADVPTPAGPTLRQLQGME